MPEGLEIDRDPRTKLNGQISMYAEHVLVCTGRDDWPSKIEDDPEPPPDGGNGAEGTTFNFTRELKDLFGRKGEFGPLGPFRDRPPAPPISILNASFPPSPYPQSISSPTSASPSPTAPSHASTSVYLLPSFKYIPHLGQSPSPSAKTLAETYLVPKDWVSGSEAPEAGSQQSQRTSLAASAQDVTDVLVLICGHGGRDMRCGIMGPLLAAEFRTALQRVSIKTDDAPRTLSPESPDPGSTARVGLISHIGGHKFAGNIIVYIPPGMRGKDGEQHPLAGCGIWYGRVEPKHVEGIVSETVLGGRVIQELVRGGIGADRRIWGF